MENKVAVALASAVGVIAGMVALLSGGPVFVIVVALITLMATFFAYAALHSETLRWELRWYVRWGVVLVIFATCFLIPSQWLRSQFKKEFGSGSHTTSLESPTYRPGIAIQRFEVAEVKVGEPLKVLIQLCNNAGHLLAVSSVHGIQVRKYPLNGMAREVEAEDSFQRALSVFRVVRAAETLEPVPLPPGCGGGVVVRGEVLTPQSIQALREYRWMAAFTGILHYKHDGNERTVTFCFLGDGDLRKQVPCVRHNDPHILADDLVR